MSKSIFQSAIDAWPEDEARAVFEMYPELYESTYKGDGPEYAESELTHDCERFKKIFARESDGDELYARFMAKINELKAQFLISKV